MPQHNNLNPGSGFNFDESYKNAPSRQNTIWDFMASQDPTVKNRFNNYEHDFDFDSIKKELGDIYGGYEDIINKDAAELTAGQQKGSASRFASRGITGGSIIDDQMGSIASNINKSKSNALTKLGIGKAGDISGLMSRFNDLKIMIEKMGTGVDKFNVNSEYRKGQGLAGYDNAWQEQDRANENQPGFLEDIFAGLGDIGELAPLIAKMFAAPATGGASLAISDVRMKENIIKVGKMNGMNIYEFNYKGMTGRRFRGVIADEIETDHPNAVIHKNGIKFVNYSKIGITFLEV